MLKREGGPVFFELKYLHTEPGLRMSSFIRHRITKSVRTVQTLSAEASISDTDKQEAMNHTGRGQLPKSLFPEMGRTVFKQINTQLGFQTL